jgi:hypothetical protein
MELTLLTVASCPHAALFEEGLVVALAAHRGAVLRRRIVSSEREAAAAGMHGSPTLLVDGVDPFARPGEATTLSCRLYPGGAGGFPSAPGDAGRAGAASSAQATPARPAACRRWRPCAGRSAGPGTPAAIPPAAPPQPPSEPPGGSLLEIVTDKPGRIPVYRSRS